MKKKNETKERGQPQRVVVPFGFDDAMTRLIKVNPPPDGDYKAANDRRERRRKRSRK